MDKTTAPPPPPYVESSLSLEERVRRLEAAPQEPQIPTGFCLVPTHDIAQTLAAMERADAVLLRAGNNPDGPCRAALRDAKKALMIAISKK